jgi:sigma-B regulation protein RsbU (phosphoserine phosphatase)
MAANRILSSRSRQQHAIGTRISPVASSLFPASLLVVDDDEMNRDMLSRRLQGRGYAVALANDGKQALDAIASQPFDLVLLDVSMPEISGLQVLETVRRTYSVADLPIIMTTARDQRADVVRALELGANDYVTKPLDFPVVLARVQTQLSLKRAKQALETAHARMQTDLQAAAKVQRALMPRSLPAVDGARFAWRFQPCNELAGDILDIVQLDESSVGLYLLDVSGHGVQAALLSVTLSRVLSHMAEGSVLRQEAQDGGQRSHLLRPAEVAEQLNRRFPMDATTRQYFTFLYGILDLKTRRFDHASAGHPGPLHLRRGGEATVLDGSGFAIGWFPDVRYDEQSTSLSPGDRLYFYSDGVIEAGNAAGELFDRSRLIDTLRQTHSASLEDSLDTLLNEVGSWCGEAGPEDDISVVGIEIVEP